MAINLQTRIAQKASSLMQLNTNGGLLSRFVGLSTLVVMLSATSAVYADCNAGDKRLFFCNTVNNKVIQLCDAGATINYSFGRPNTQPELALQVPRHLASTWQWQGVGRWMSYSVVVPNGNTRYQIFFSVDRLSDEHPIEAGVDVEIGGKHIVRVECRDDGHLVQNLEGVDLRPEE